MNRGKTEKSKTNIVSRNWMNRKRVNYHEFSDAGALSLISGNLLIIASHLINLLDLKLFPPAFKRVIHINENNFFSYWKENK